ncbi:MAG: hypothetical protein LBC84_07275 [Prevotellaceae bacterium]|jgi:hypothetical protein|nr:hypothetical protein [Prevotellaceae bacterium]
MKKHTLLLVIIGVTTTISCSKNQIPEPEPIEKGVIVINQGNMSQQNGSISYYDQDSRFIKNLAYEEANGVSLGAVVLSGCIDEQNIAYLLCAYPDKLVRIDAPTAKVAAPDITQELVNPRNVLVHGGYIYVTNSGSEYIEDGWFWEYTNSYVAVYNQSTGTHIKNISVGSDAEGLCVANNQLFVAVKEGVKVIDLATGNIKTTIISDSFWGAAKHLVVDYQNHVWASYPDEGVMEINSSYTAEARTITVPLDYEGYITINKERDQILTFATLYDDSWQSIGSNIYAVDIKAGTHKSLISGDQFYSIGVNPYTGTLFASEANGFTTNSTLLVAKPDGTVIDTKTAGVGTARYLFY